MTPYILLCAFSNGRSRIVTHFWYDVAGRFFNDITDFTDVLWVSIFVDVLAIFEGTYDSEVFLMCSC